MTEPVLVERQGAIQVVTLNRPQARNAIDAAVTRALAAALDELDGDDSLVLGVLTGAGGTFCAGMDLKAFLRGEDVTLPGRGLGGMVRRPPRKPVIAAVEGYALAGGFELVLACDLVVAARTAAFGIPEVRRGLVAASGGLLRLPRRLPYHLAMELALTGALLDAATAAHHGLVNRVTEPGEALSAALDLAGTIAANAPLAVQASRQVIVESGDWPLAEAFERQDGVIGHIEDSADAQEGARAFAEKRPPRWEGR
ncbi:crotonase/enoyl-CoA hydratase family protein [Amycolatopsis jejuensis]|uniref:crotonase/enoyl-CoA hydratase family protein n=1 Tax=Amycolatopsis jejuensis TaxID=330084 RepID=UPI0005243E98|nr:crotonase/enoyl-CoA hydratase family protein [Amycolatopsis jejuensis]